MKRISALATAAALLLASPAFAQFQIESSTTASQQVELELLNTIRTGSFAAGTDRSAHEAGVNWGALKFWNAGLSVLIVNPRGGSPTVDGVRWTSTVAIFGGEAGPGINGMSLALYMDVLLDLGTPEQHVLTIGPALGGDFAPLEVALNTFATIPLSGANRDVGFRYAAGAMYDVSHSVALGMEAHGEIPRVFDNRPSFSRQEHVLGPALRLRLEPENSRGADLRLGSFFGLTSAAPTVGLSANLELDF